MMLTKIIIGLFGLIEVAANLIFLLRFFEREDFQYAQVFHGDLPQSASQKAWLLKITASFLLGLVALAGTLVFLFHLTSLGLALYYLFGLGMLVMTLIQALYYGKQHWPAKFALILGLVFLLLVFFQI
ncbi:hypothetical protein [Streptococcus merionis]|uniref:Uncharacterized protein n=1 Tax=Streptococcus merionis TaxID=400065 RepID=A0A239SVH8_9STRE|nr:hypothetical protein [Streptococcus merionis]SNU89491.1 Uncharacterised protein [Streptococcus merionis]